MLSLEALDIQRCQLNSCEGAERDGGLRKSGAVALRTRKDEYGNDREQVNRRSVKTNCGMG